MNREAFMERVRRAVREGNRHPLSVDDPGPDVGYVGCGDDRCQALADEVEAVGGQAHLVASVDEARAAVARLVGQYEVRAALCWQHPLLDQLGIHQLLAERQVESITFDHLERLDADARRQRMLEATIGISSVDFAVAETGTLVVASRPGQERVVSLAPPVHVALVARSQTVPDLFDVFDALGQRDFADLPSNVAFITGPSKTGDIELQLTTGVHGPGHWHVVIIR